MSVLWIGSVVALAVITLTRIVAVARRERSSR